MATLSFLFLKATLISYLCTAPTLALPSSSHFPKQASTIWKNDKLFPDVTHFSDGSLARFILVREIENANGEYGFGFCFYCNSPPTNSCYLSIVFIEIYHDQVADAPPMIVWSANRDRPVGENSVLIFSVGGDLILKDSNRRPIWSTNASQSSTIGMRMEHGNLVLLNQTNGTAWQSSDHPTDTLLWGQRLKKGQQLTSSASSVDLGSGLFYLCLENYYLSAYATGKNTYNYLRVSPDSSDHNYASYSLTHIQFGKGNVSFCYQELKGPNEVQFSYEIPVTADVQLLKLDADGGLRIYGWDSISKWWAVYYFKNGWKWGECQFPLKCGRYGVCQNNQCACPVALDGTAPFAPYDTNNPNLGCHQVNDLGYKDTHYSYGLQNFGHLSYFSYYDEDRAAPGLNDEESCIQACLRNGSSCMAAFFYYLNITSRGYCYLVEDVFSIVGAPMSNDDYYYYTSSYINVKIYSTTNVPVPAHFYKSKTLPIALATCAFVLLCVFLSLLFRRKQILRERIYFKRLSEILLRFSYSELSVSTRNFSQKLGGGGFGLVFKGTLADGRMVAVKRLEANGQGKKEFLAEVETVGKIHHFNLVGLIGFCVENKHMVIVYEYLANGSLEKWIFSESQNTSLDWEVRKKIVLGVAKGLAYIHEECRQRIAHLDVKPHNILLDDSFNAKISDFGMSKLINRDESQVMTGMRGTLGYLAPEWRGSKITVKADVYSFGILVLEVVSGRKVLDYSQPESGVHLLKLLKKKSVENRIIDIVDSRCEDTVSNSEDVVNMIRLAMRCLHSDYKRRPTMSTVVKVLEGSLELEPNFTYNFSSIFSPARSDSNA